MTSSLSEVIGYVTVVASWLLTGASLANDYWRISTIAGSVITTQREFVNLWHTCTESSLGISQCRDFDTILGLPEYVQACRALMILSLLLGLASMIVSLFGLRCISVGSSNEVSKAKISITGGILSLVSGTCSMVAVSWYAVRVVEAFYDPFTAGQRYELGAGLFIGWSGASLAIVGGCLLLTACKRASTGGKKGGYYGNQPQTIYKTTAKSDPDSRAYV
ncbi:claudin 15-like a [Genypterus blacodes]|uniref:claudin 15-like a n=1 Tax=Genypterus blacodes TaxID=154954 RepID=UPI003F75A57C